MTMTKNVESQFGCKPYYVAGAERVNDLANAILKNSENIDCEYQKIENWAKEIISHCEFSRLMDKEGEET